MPLGGVPLAVIWRGGRPLVFRCVWSYVQDTAMLEMDLLEFWLSKQPGAVFYSPPEVIRGLLPVGLLEKSLQITAAVK